MLCVFGLTSVSASDLNETVISQIDDGASLEDAPELSVGKNNEPEILSVNYTPQNFSEIQTAVDNASDGDIITIDGYNLFEDTIAVNSSLTFVGKNNATIDGNNSIKLFAVNAKGVVFENITFMNGIAFEGSGISCVDCSFVNNSVEKIVPVAGKDTAQITVKKQTFAYKKNGKWAITLKDSTGKAISNVKVTLKVYTGKKFKTYTSTATNSKGVAYFNKINELALGNHKVVVSFSNKNYNCKAVSSSINVVKQTQVKIKVISRTTSKGFSVSVMVKDKSGKKFVNGVKVKMTVGSGKNMKTVTLVSGNYGNGKGVCAYSTNMMPAGTHKVSVTSADIKYVGSAASKVTLKASAKKYGSWWEKISNGINTSYGLK